MIAQLGAGPVSVIAGSVGISVRGARSADRVGQAGPYFRTAIHVTACNTHQVCVRYVCILENWIVVVGVVLVKSELLLSLMNVFVMISFALFFLLLMLSSQ